MKCRYCGCEIPDGYVYCERCGREVQMVPDYNPLDDILTSHVNGTSGQYNRGRVSYTYSSTRQSAASRMLEEQEREAEERETARRKARGKTEKREKKKRIKSQEEKADSLYGSFCGSSYSWNLSSVFQFLYRDCKQRKFSFGFKKLRESRAML